MNLTNNSTDEIQNNSVWLLESLKNHLKILTHVELLSKLFTLTIKYDFRYNTRAQISMMVIDWSSQVLITKRISTKYSGDWWAPSTQSNHPPHRSIAKEQHCSPVIHLLETTVADVNFGVMRVRREEFRDSGRALCNSIIGFAGWT